MTPKPEVLDQKNRENHTENSTFKHTPFFVFCFGHTVKSPWTQNRNFILIFVAIRPSRLPDVWARRWPLGRSVTGMTGRCLGWMMGFFWGVKDVKIQQALMLTAPFSSRGWGEWVRRVQKTPLRVFGARGKVTLYDMLLYHVYIVLEYYLAY